MERVMIRGHASITELRERGPSSGTLHRVPEVDGIIISHGEDLFVIPRLTEAEDTAGGDQPPSTRASSSSASGSPLDKALASGKS